ncbi:patatin-like phospholipase family protein [Sphingosinicella sp. LHD-64]|uniref:patatin-like phospholipase family protein n=1 Tax=Sphingosinicella sp. LHD-64 TaxID=3072139 RepID=UPI00280EFA38|nr:patatin-like phospholipase family protein [Sphingosinicella sp. LHD-64]MDQ8757974.1 patatin-like phospholipase family protein [Sphingosinicella sp. LHD-64]
MAGDLAIVLSGGGAKGAFQVGVVHELVANRGVKIDIIAGVSTGAIQALGVAQDDVPAMLQQWLEIKGNGSIYKERPLGLVGGILGEDAIYDAAPLRQLLKDFADDRKLKASGRKLRIGVVNLGTGAYRSIDEKVPGIHNWVYASSAMPVFFDPLRTRASDGTEEQWVDGGVRNVTPLDAALELNPRGVIVVRASPRPQPGKVRTFPNLIKIGLRAVDILQSEVSANDTANATLINDMIAAREAQARALQSEGITGAAAARILRPLDLQIARYRFAPIRLIEPEEDYSETLEFDPKKIRKAIDAGRKAVEREWEALEPLLS